MNNFAKILLPAVLFVSACGGEKPTEYVFDASEFRENVDKYTVSGNSIGCMFGSIIFYKEALEAVKNLKKPDLENSDNWSPTSINLYEDKIEWNDLGKESKIVNDKVELDLSGVQEGNVSITVSREGDMLMLGTENKGTVCKMPFKKVK